MFRKLYYICTSFKFKLFDTLEICAVFERYKFWGKTRNK